MLDDLLKKPNYGSTQSGGVFGKLLNKPLTVSSTPIASGGMSKYTPPTTISSATIAPTPKIQTVPTPQPNPNQYAAALASTQPVTNFGTGYSKEFGYNTPTAPTIPPPTTTASTPTTPQTATLPNGQVVNLDAQGNIVSGTAPTTPTTGSQDIINNINSSTPAETVQQGLVDKILEKFGLTTKNRVAEQQKAEETAQVPLYQKQLSDINSQITAINNEAQAMALRSEDRQAPMFAIRGEQAQIERGRAVKALSLSSAAAAIQGNLALAQDQADRAVALQFAPAEEELALLEKQYELNKDTLEREDKKKADALAVMIDERKTQLEEEKTNKAEVLKIANAAALAGAPSTVLQRISTTQNPLEAAQFASPYLGIEQGLQNDLIRQQIATSKASEAKTYADMKSAINSTGTASGDLQSIVTQYTSQKNVPAQLKTQLTKGLNIINKLDSMIANSPEGKFAGASPLQGAYAFVAPEFLTPKSTTGFAADEAKLRQDLVTYITGAAYTTLQADDVNKIVPRTSLTDSKNQQRIEQLYNTVVGDIQSALVASGFNANLPRVSNVFQGTDNYAQYRNQLNEGEILVQRGDDIVAILPQELTAGDIEI